MNRIDPRKVDRAAIGSFFEALALGDLDRMLIDDLMRYAPESSDTALMTTLGLMFAALGDGSLCVDLDSAVSDIRMGDDAARLAASALARFNIRMSRGDYDRLILRCDRRPDPSVDASGRIDVVKPLVLDVVNGRRLLYFQKFHFHERRLMQRLNAFFGQAPARRWSVERIDAIVDELYTPGSVIRKGPGRKPIVRDPYQEAAIRAAMTAPLIVVSGGPGTGKTSLLVNMLRALTRAGMDPSRILLTAPTGRAAQRMTEALTASLASIQTPDEGDLALARHSGSTLHKMLVWRRRGNRFLYGARRPIPADIIAVDEVSMVDVVMMDHLLQAIDPKRTRLILLGDKDQLPSVDAGSVLADLPRTVGGGMDAFVELKTIYRSSGDLTELARAINTGSLPRRDPVDFDTALRMDRHCWAFVHAGDGSSIGRHIDRWIEHQYDAATMPPSPGFITLIRRLVQLSAEDAGDPDDPARDRYLNQVFDQVGRCRILCAARRGPCGAAAINTTIADGLRTTLDPTAAKPARLFAGALIMITRNDYRRELFNGDIGVVLPHGPSAYQVHFRRGHRLFAFVASGLPEWEFAYAMTVHKSQGSEFEDAWLILPDDPNHRLLTREILYTAATRAANRLILYGSPAALQTALNRKIVRQSGMV